MSDICKCGGTREDHQSTDTPCLQCEADSSIIHQHNVPSWTGGCLKCDCTVFQPTGMTVQ